MLVPTLNLVLVLVTGKDSARQAHLQTGLTCWLAPGSISENNAALLTSIGHSLHSPYSLEN